MNWSKTVEKRGKGDFTSTFTAVENGVKYDIVEQTKPDKTVKLTGLWFKDRKGRNHYETFNSAKDAIKYIEKLVG